MSINTLEQVVEHCNNLAELNYELVKYGREKGVNWNILTGYLEDKGLFHLSALLDVATYDVENGG